MKLTKMKLLAALIVGASAMPAMAVPMFGVTYAGDFSPTAINNSGQVVGRVAGATVLYSGSSLSVLGGSNMVVTGINDAATVVGYQTSNTGVRQAFIQSNGTLTNIGAASVDVGDLSINNAGQVAGSFGVAGDQRHAFLYQDGTLTDLNQGQAAPFEGSATAINNQGQIAGTAGEYSWSATPVIYANGTTTPLANSRPDGYQIYASGISDNSDVLLNGRYGPSGSIESFVYSKGVLTNIGEFSGLDINGSSLVVGTNALGGGSAHLWDSGTLYNLNSLIDPASGWYLQSAVGINDNNQIAAFGCRTTGALECGTLILSAQGVSAVPEPTTYAMMLGGLGMLGFMARRRRAAKSTA